MKKIFILFAAVLCSLTLSAKKPVNTQWTPEQAREWWSHTEWPVGCCYVPTYAINQFEMWQEDTFNPEILDKEMALCEDLGFNMVSCRSWCRYRRGPWQARCGRSPAGR